jgi:hypothetical protein
MRAAAFVCLFGGAAACAPFGAHDANSPEWFKTKLKETQHKPFPKLASVPATPAPSALSTADWSAIQSEVSQAGAALDSSPRSAPADQSPEATAAFDEQARKEAEGQRGAAP